MGSNNQISFVALLASLCPLAAQAGSSALSTRSGMELGVAASSYRYDEDVNDRYFMSLKGAKLAATAAYTRAIASRYFWRSDGRLAFGLVDYDSASTGSKSGNPDVYLEARSTVGTDLPTATQLIAPYLGVGLRYLLNDLRGQTTTGASGYRRSSYYLYVPAGLTHRVQAGRGARIASTLEYDHLVLGLQRSHMRDIEGYTSDLFNRQNRGHGWRASVAYERSNWSLSAYWIRWDIDRSDSSTFTSATTLYTGYEPHNTTHEVGLQLSWRLF